MAVKFDIGVLLDSDPEYWGGRPFVRGKRVTVQRIAIAHRRGETAEAISNDFDLEIGEVHAALAYYFVNRAEVEADIDAFDEESSRLAAQANSTT